MHAPVTHILPLTHVRRARLLPVAGKVLVRNGQSVNASDVIAEAYYQNRHVLVDVRSMLRLSRKDLERVMDRQAGERVQKGDVLAEARGIFRRVVRAPIDGEIVSVSNGQIMIEAPGAPFQLRAGISGTVSEVLPERGAIIEADGALIQAVWGNGGIGVGMLLNLMRSADEELSTDRLDVSMRGAVVTGGHVADGRVLENAADLPLRGMILSSMSSELAPLALRLDMPVLLIEGFGRIAMNQPAYRLLTTSEKRDVSVYAVAYSQFTGDRPEVFIGLPASGEQAVEAVEFESGQQVRILSEPYRGLVGSLVQVFPALMRLPNGVRATSASVRLETGEQVTVPLSNLDVLE